MDYLTEDAVFSCNMLPEGIFSCSERKNTKLFKNGRKLLTDGADCPGSMAICKILTAQRQTPTPCKGNCLLGNWCNIKSSVVSGGALLTSESFKMCSYGGQIKAKISGTFGTLSTGADSSFVANPTLIEVESIILSNNDEKELQSKTVEESLSDNQLTDDVDSSTEEKSFENNLLCPKCENYEECLYPKTHTTVNNDSMLLRKNYNKDNANDAIDKYCTSQIEENPEYSYVAHHIISGNQVFKQFPEIVRLANFYGYDINNALNCILLVSKEDEYGNRKKEVSAFDAMSNTGLQWHLGGHSYKFSKADLDNIRKIEYLSQQKVTNGLKNYAQLLIEELQKIQDTLESNKVCRNTERQKGAFLRRLNKLSQKIKEKIGAFRNKRRDSFPYYVSKVAFDFTFGLPRTGKVIVVRPGNNGNISLEKYRVQRLIRDENNNSGDRNLYFKPIINTQSNQCEFDLTDVKDRKECILFCENITHFIFSSNDTRLKLPFSIDFKYIYYMDDSNISNEEFFKKYNNELLVWFRDNQPDGYVAPKRMIKMRLKEVDI